MVTKIESFDLVDLKGKAIFHFVTLTDKNIYVVYKENKKVREILDIFNKNYDIGIKNHKVNFKSATLERNFEETDLMKTPKELNLSDLEKITLSAEYFQVVTPIDKSKSNKNDPDLQKITIFIRTITGRDMSLLVNNLSTIYDLKELIQEKEGIPPDQQRLTFRGLILDEDKTLAELHIHDCSTIHLILRLRGGMYHETSGKNGNFKSLENCLIVMED